MCAVCAYPGSFFFDILHNIAHLAFEDAAEHFDGVGADAFIPLQPGELPGTDPVVLDEHILGDAPFLHHSPELVVRNHKNTTLPIDIITEFGI